MFIQLYLFWWRGEKNASKTQSQLFYLPAEHSVFEYYYNIIASITGFNAFFLRDSRGEEIMDSLSNDRKNWVMDQKSHFVAPPPNFYDQILLGLTNDRHYSSSIRFQLSCIAVGDLFCRMKPSSIHPCIEYYWVDMSLQKKFLILYEKKDYHPEFFFFLFSY